MSLDSVQADLVLRYLKHRWLRDVRDLLDASASSDRLHLDDVDLDKDLIELGRVSGVEQLTALALDVLQAREPLTQLPAAERALAALRPELEPAQAEAFLRLLATNLAFRLRSDELLRALTAFTAEAAPPRPDPAVIGAWLARARSSRDARSLIRESPLSGADEEAALAAADAPATPTPGARVHVQTSIQALEPALVKAMRPLIPLPWSLTLDQPDARRVLALRPRGGWITLVEDGDDVPVDLARALAAESGVVRAAWARFPAETDDEPQPPKLTVFEGTRLALSDEDLAARIGEPPTMDDVAGALRELGVLDVDPGHPRGAPDLSFGANLSNQRKRGVHSFAFGR